MTAFSAFSSIFVVAFTWIVPDNPRYIMGKCVLFLRPYLLGAFHRRTRLQSHLVPVARDMLIDSKYMEIEMQVKDRRYQFKELFNIPRQLSSDSVSRILYLDTATMRWSVLPLPPFANAALVTNSLPVHVVLYYSTKILKQIELRNALLLSFPLSMAYSSGLAPC